MSAPYPELGVLFDWDGVIIDSSRQHEASWERLAEEEALPLPVDHFVKGFGRKNEQIIPEILGWTRDPDIVRRLSLRKEELYRTIVVERGLEALPGVVVFLSRLRAAGVPFCVGSSTHRQNIVTLLRLVGLAGWFNGIVTAEDVVHGKPHPDVFLKCASTIGRDPRNCVVFEDAFAGIEAARAGGMKVVGVATTHAPEALRGRVDRVVRRLDEITVAGLAELITA